MIVVYISRILYFSVHLSSTFLYLFVLNLSLIFALTILCCDPIGVLSTFTVIAVITGFISAFHISSSYSFLLPDKFFFLLVWGLHSNFILRKDYLLLIKAYCYTLSYFPISHFYFPISIDIFYIYTLPQTIQII